ncbi:MAG: HNH endonuclease [Nitrospira sp. CG24E]|nr:MAG: HNH endonuclease [Nitrospira sp. CG24E]
MDNNAGPEGLIAQLLEAGLAGKPGIGGKPWRLGLCQHVRMWVRHGYRCGYCDEDLLSDLPRMMSAQLDHLLPKKEYPDLRDAEDNWVLACFRCNQLKRTFNPWKSLPGSVGSPTRENIASYRHALIEASWKNLEQRRDEQRAMHLRVTSILAMGNG